MAYKRKFYFHVFVLTGCATAALLLPGSSAEAAKGLVINPYPVQQGPGSGPPPADRTASIADPDHEPAAVQSRPLQREAADGWNSNWKPKQAMEPVWDYNAEGAPVAAQSVSPPPMALSQSESQPDSPPISILQPAQQGKAWQAFAGASVRDILTFWSRDAGVELLWASDMNYPVAQTLDVQGSYQDAVGQLLEQFTGQYDRPVGTLHIDQQTGQQVLVVQDHKNG